MKPTTKLEIEEATQRYAEALTNHMIAKRNVETSQVEMQKTQKEVVLSFGDLQALRFQS